MFEQDFVELPNDLWENTIPYYIGLTQREAHEAIRTAMELWHESTTSGELLAKVASVANDQKEATYLGFMIGSEIGKKQKRGLFR